MRAVLCHSYCEPEDLKLEEVDDPVAEANQVVIDIHATSINFPDTLIIAGKYQSKPPFPFSPGGELAGTIRTLGADVTGWAVGDCVIASVGHGGFAEQIAVPASYLRAVPEGMDFSSAAALTTAYGTSYYALKQRGQLQAGETLLVLGAAGGVGTAAVELGKAMGARVIAAASTDEKLEVAKRLGADAGVNYADGEMKDKVKALTDGRGADVIYDPVGGPLFEQCLRCINWNGRLLVIGFASGEIPRPPMNLPLLKNCQIVGVFYGASISREPETNTANIKDIMDFFKAGKIKPLIGKTYPLSGYAAALRCLMNREAIGKIVVQVRD